MRRGLSAVIALALLLGAGSAAGHAAQRGAPTPVVPGLATESAVASPSAPSAPLSRTPRVASEVPLLPSRPYPLRTRPKRPIPAFEVALAADGPVRPGGTGRFRVRLARQRSAALRAPVRLGLALSPGLRVASVRGAGWDCEDATGTARLRCVDGRAGARRGSPGDLLVTVRADRSLARRGRAGATVVARWQTGRWREHERERARARVLPALTARIAPTAAIHATPKGARSRTHTLSATITGHAGRPVRHAFRQLCIDRARLAAEGCAALAPKVRWLGRHASNRAAKAPSATFAVPRLGRATDLRFELRASEKGALARGRTTLRVLPRELASWDPRREQTVAALRGGTVPDRSGWIGNATPRGLEARVGRPGPTRVRAGERVALRVRSRGTGTRYRWSVRRGPGRLLARVATSGPTLRFTAPASPQHLLVSVTARDEKGRVDRADEVVVVGPALGRTPSARAAKRANQATSESALQKEFCTLYASNLATVENAFGIAGATFTPGTTTTSGTSCMDGSAAISGTAGALTIDEHTLSGLAFTVVPDGSGYTLKITHGTYVPPAGLGLPASVSFTTPTIPKTTSQPFVGAALQSDGSFGTLTGGITLSEGLPFLTPPGGWTASPTTLALVEPRGGGTPTGLTLNAGMTGPGDASVTLGGTFGFDGSVAVTATGANVVDMTSYDGRSTATASITGTISRAAHATGAPRFSLTGAIAPVSPATTFDLFENVSLTSGTATLDDSGLSATADVTVDALGDDLDLTISGDWKNASDWSLDVAQAGTWSSGGFGVGGLTGTVARSTPPGQTTAVTTFSAGASSITVPESLSSAVGSPDFSASVGNACPAAPATGGKSSTATNGTGATGTSCDTSQVTLLVTATDGRITLPVTGDTVDYTATATVDLSTLDYTFSGALDGTFGPSELNLSAVQITVTDDSSTPSVCGGATTGTRIGFVASASIPQIDITSAPVQGELVNGGKDYCLQAVVPSSFSPLGITALEGATLLYTSDTKGGSFSVKHSAPSVAVPAGTPTLAGSFTTPEGLQTLFDRNLPSSGSYTAALTRDATTHDVTGFQGGLDLQLLDPARIAGDADGTHLDVSHVDLTLDVDTAPASKSFGLGVAASGVILGSGSHPIPLDGSLNVSLSEASGTTSASLDAQLGIDPTSKEGCPTGLSPCVSDAFGVDGLTLHTLAVSGRVSTSGSPSLAIDADVALPDSWTEPLGVAAGAPIGFGAELSETSSCLVVSVGTKGSTTQAVSLVDGIVTAEYANVVYAPDGCTLPTSGTTSVTIPQGFALSFDGAIAGDPVQVAARVGDGNAFSIDANVEMGPFSLLDGTISLTAPPANAIPGAAADACHVQPQGGLSGSGVPSGGPLFHLRLGKDVSPAVRICGQIDVGGSGILAAVDYSQSDDEITAGFDVNADISVAGFKLDSADVDGSLTVCEPGAAAACQTAIDVNLDVEADLLGVRPRFTGGLDYEDGSLRQVAIDVQVNGDVFGNLASANVGFDFSYLHDYTPPTAPGKAPQPAFDRTKVTYDFGACIFFGCFEFHGIIFETGKTLTPPKRPIVVTPPEVLMNALEAVSYMRGGGQNCESYTYSSSDTSLQASAFPHDGFPGRYTQTQGSSCNYYFHFRGENLALAGAEGGQLAAGSSTGELYLCLNTNPAKPGRPDIRALTGDASDPAGPDTCINGDARFDTQGSNEVDVNAPGSEASLEAAAGATGLVYITSARNIPDLGSLPRPPAEDVNPVPTTYTSTSRGRPPSRPRTSAPAKPAKRANQVSGKTPYPPIASLEKIETAVSQYNGNDHFMPFVVSNFTGDPLNVMVMSIACAYPSGASDTPNPSWATLWQYYEPGGWGESQSGLGGARKVQAGTNPLTNHVLMSLDVEGGEFAAPAEALPWAVYSYLAEGDSGSTNLQVLGSLWSTLWFLTPRDLTTPVSGHLLNPRPDYQLPFSAPGQTTQCGNGDAWLYLQATDTAPAGTAGAGFASAIVRVSGFAVEQIIPLTVEQPTGGDTYLCMWNTGPGYDLPHWKEQGGPWPFQWRSPSQSPPAIEWSQRPVSGGAPGFPSSSPPPARGPLAPPTGSSSWFGLESTSYRWSDPTLYPFPNPGGVQITVGTATGDPNQIRPTSDGSTCGSDPGHNAGAW